MGALEAALFRPQSGYYADIAEEAAALLESLLINHPFMDGNKRTAVAACDVFLRINGHCLNADPDSLYPRIMAWIAESEDRFARILADARELLKAKPRFRRSRQIKIAGRNFYLESE